MARMDSEIYQRSHPLRMAYIDGKLDLCEQIKDLAQVIIATNNISPFKPASDFEDGQIAALNAILEACGSIEESALNESNADRAYDA